MIRYDTQAAYRGTVPRTDLIRAANRMGRLIDLRRPKGLPLMMTMTNRMMAAGEKTMSAEELSTIIRSFTSFSSLQLHG